jgi:hypothetical protein
MRVPAVHLCCKAMRRQADHAVVYRTPGWRAAARKTKMIPGFRRKAGI